MAKITSQTTTESNSASLALHVWSQRSWSSLELDHQRRSVLSTSLLDYYLLLLLAVDLECSSISEHKVVMSDGGSMDSPQEDRKSVQICEDPNSKAHLEALFNVLSQDQPKPVKGKPMIERNLPNSFFDASLAANALTNQEKTTIRRLGPSISVGPSSGPGTQHLRSMSMPATLDHSRQFSLDSALSGPIPPGWEMARTPDGLPYFIE